QVLKGIKHVHGNRMAHRNITPDSILVDTETFKAMIDQFCFCVDGEKEGTTQDELAEGYRQDIVSVGYLLAYFYLGEEVLYESMYSNGLDLSEDTTDNTSSTASDKKGLENFYRKWAGLFPRTGWIFLKRCTLWRTPRGV
ncbi:MAG: uncharacterized protein A8A55_3457, partial [Amphiamblys sp. WSBS2006]